MNKIQLKFGQTEATNIDVYMLVKNNEKYLPHFFENMSAIESTYEISMQYYILENDSNDKSLELIKNFLKDRNGMIVYPGNRIKFDQLNRLKRMELLRNTLINSNSEKKSEWSLIIDSDIYFVPETIERLLRVDPKGKKIGMLCAYGIEFYDQKNNKFETLNHYYDTYTYIDENRTLYWPHCIFRDCKKCSGKTSGSALRSPEGIIEVASAFGGLAIVDTAALRHPNVKWEAIPQERIVMCEHIGFCINLQKITNLKVAIDCDTKVYWEIPGK